MSENPIALRSKNSTETALLSLMREQPYRKISIRAIMARAGLSRQTFYLNFEDKDAILARCLGRLFDDIMHRVHREQAASVPALVSTYTGVVVENAAFFRILADNNLNGLVCRLFRERLDTMPPVLPCQRENRTDAERRCCNAFWVAAFIEVYAQWLSEDMQTERSEIDRILTDVMLGNYFRPQTDGQQ